MPDTLDLDALEATVEELTSLAGGLEFRDARYLHAALISTIRDLRTERDALREVVEAVGRMKDCATTPDLSPEHRAAIKNVAWNVAWTAHDKWLALKGATDNAE